MSIQQIKKDKIQAMKNKDTAKLSTLNLLIAELEKEMKLTGATELTKDQTETVVSRQIKKLDKEIEAYVAVGRTTEKQEYEKIVLYAYLPKQLTEEEIRDLVAGVIATSKTIGEAMKSLSAQLKGKADMGLVSRIAKELKN